MQCPVPECGAVCSANETVTGKTVKCPKCGNPFAARPTLDGQSRDTQKSRPKPHADPFPSLPAEFGRYRVLKLLGRGGMGAVYLAQDSQLGRKVALKIPFIDGTDSKRVERFAREGRSAASLHHPNICTVFDAGAIDGQPYITMAYLAGTPLDQLIDPENPLPPRRAAEIARGIALALAYAHENGVVHRDLKPANVMLTAGGGPVVMDFGLAKMSGDVDAKLDLGRAKMTGVEGGNEVKLTRQGGLLGTPSYMAPEQVRGDLEVIGPATDVYALGIVLFEMLAGQTPFSGPLAAVLGQILAAPVPSVRALRPDAPVRLEAACSQALAKNPSERFGSMAEFAAALGRYLDDPPPAAPPPLPTQLLVNVDRLPSPAENGDTFEQLEAAPTPAVRARAGKKGRPVFVGLALALLIPLAIGLAAVILRVETPNGTLVVELEGDEVEARFRGGKLILSGRDGKTLYTLAPGVRDNKIDAGVYKVRVEGADGLALDTSEFNLRKGEKVTVRVRADGRGRNPGVEGPKLAEGAPPPKDESAEMVLAENSEWAGVGIVKKGSGQSTKAAALTITERRGVKLKGLFRVENAKHVVEGTVTGSGDVTLQSPKTIAGANPAPLKGGGEASKNRMTLRLIDSNDETNSSYEFKRLPDGGDGFHFEGRWMCFDQPTGWRGVRPVREDGTLFQGMDRHEWTRDGGLIRISFGQWLAIDPDNPNVLNGGGSYLTLKWIRQ